MKLRSKTQVGMGSSSALFPVQLIGAERCAEFDEDVYLISPPQTRDPSAKVAVVRLSLAASQQGQPLLFIHGSFSNRRFWYSDKGVGIAAMLCRQGYDVWVLEQRGHGQSPLNRDLRDNTVEVYGREDIPAVVAFIQEQNGDTPFLIGHSMGGVIAYSALAMEPSLQQQVKGVVSFGSEIIPRWWPWSLFPAVSALRFMLRKQTALSGARSRRGPENEPVGVLLEQLRWMQRWRSWRLADGTSLWPAYEEMQLPVLQVAGAVDKLAPLAACDRFFKRLGGDNKQLLELSTAKGFSCDYGHVDMLVSKSAEQEVWPLIHQWLQQPKQ